MIEDEIPEAERILRAECCICHSVNRFAGTAAEIWEEYEEWDSRHLHGRP